METLQFSSYRMWQFSGKLFLDGRKRSIHGDKNQKYYLIEETDRQVGNRTQCTTKAENAMFCSRNSEVK